ncbi:uroporphyrinogen-III C-methyltransferase [Methanocella sp. MCL-LM]|uniref:uroporphyrinogen-III C-methyltransferase n=1 Tax=Methanocella sp. MCL-LM TaxID=3412035 RepID=UPI003C790AF2
MTTTAGKVYLIGGGPGDPELITLKAVRILGQADVILYDALVGPGIRQYFNPEAELIDVGKRADKHTVPQEEMNRMLVEQAKKHKVVARLKGGDPYVFGRGGEEAEELAKNNIDFEVVPGISSAIAAPAAASIPVTHRDLASSVTFITGHEDPTKGESALNFKSLAAMNGTLVILMGVSRLRDNVQALLDNGKAADTPVAIVEKGTTPGQRITVGTLTTIVDLAEKRGVEAPAIVVVGDVVKMHEVLGVHEVPGVHEVSGA